MGNPEALVREQPYLEEPLTRRASGRVRAQSNFPAREPGGARAIPVALGTGRAGDPTADAGRDLADATSHLVAAAASTPAYCEVVE